jgi:hypothetical protein
MPDFVADLLADTGQLSGPIARSPGPPTTEDRDEKSDFLLTRDQGEWWVMPLWP